MDDKGQFDLYTFKYGEDLHLCVTGKLGVEAYSAGNLKSYITTKHIMSK